MDTLTRPVSPAPAHARRHADAQAHPKTQSAYIRAVCRFTRYLGRAPDTATVEDLRNYQLHLVDSGTSPMSLNAAISGLKFFFDITLQRGELMARMQPVRLPQRLPVVLSREVARLIAACNNLKHQTALSLAYATGLRASEVVSLKVSDVDSARDPAGRTRQRRRIATRCSRHCCWSGCACGGGSPGRRARCSMAAGCSGPQPDRVTEPASAQSRCSGRRPGGQHRQAGVDAHASPLFRVPDYAAPSQLGPGKQAAVRVSAAEDSRWLGMFDLLSGAYRPGGRRSQWNSYTRMRARSSACGQVCWVHMLMPLPGN